MVMCRNQQGPSLVATGSIRGVLTGQPEKPWRIDGANRESPDRLAHVLVMGSGKWSKVPQNVDGMGAWTCIHARRTR